MHRKKATPWLDRGVGKARSVQVAMHASFEFAATRPLSELSFEGEETGGKRFLSIEVVVDGDSAALAPVAVHRP